MMMVDMISSPVLRMVDAVTVPVPDLDQGLAFYRDGLGHKLIWRNDEIRQAGLRLPDGETEIVLSEHQPYAPNWLVSSVSEAVADVIAAGRLSGAMPCSGGQQPPAPTTRCAAPATTKSPTQPDGPSAG